MVKRIKKIPVREISKKTPAKIFHKWRLIACLLVLGIGLIGAKKIVDYLSTAKLFQVEEVRLYGYDQKSVDLSGKLDQLKKKNIFKVDIKNLQQNLKKDFPEIKSATVYKRLPNRIDIEMIPRVPLASIAGWRVVLVDADGFVYSPQSPDDYSELPRITGVHFGKAAIKLNRKSDALQLKRALEVLALLKKFGLTEKYKVNVVNVSNYRNVRLSLEEGTRIELGSDDYESKTKTLKEVLNDIKQSGKRAKVIDLRYQEARITF